MLNRDQRLLDLTDATGYQLIQRNGQRIYGGPPPHWQGPPPPQGSEIFVGKVPRDLIEADIVPIFEQIGPIYELRLMMDFSGSNRGFFFIRYTSVEDAKRAARQLNNFEIRPGKHLGVVHSKDNRKLWISGVPSNQSAEEIKQQMAGLTEGVKNVILYSSPKDKTKARSYAFVEYESHRAAALARRTLVPRKIYLCGQEVHHVDWAEPEPEVDLEIMKKVKILFARNLMPETTEPQIRSVFTTLCTAKGRFPANAVERVKKSNDFAFIHFASREAAEEALLNCSNELIIDNAKIDVSWSKPAPKSSSLNKQGGGSNNYAKYEPSVPQQKPYMSQMYSEIRTRSSQVRQPQKTTRPVLLAPPNTWDSPLRQVGRRALASNSRATICPPPCYGAGPSTAFRPARKQGLSSSGVVAASGTLSPMAPLSLPYIQQQQQPPQSPTVGQQLPTPFNVRSLSNPYGHTSNHGYPTFQAQPGNYMNGSAFYNNYYNGVDLVTATSLLQPGRGCQEVYGGATRDWLPTYYKCANGNGSAEYNDNGEGDHVQTAEITALDEE